MSGPLVVVLYTSTNSIQKLRSQVNILDFIKIKMPFDYQRLYDSEICHHYVDTAIYLVHYPDHVTTL